MSKSDSVVTLTGLPVKSERFIYKQQAISCPSRVKLMILDKLTSLVKRFDRVLGKVFVNVNYFTFEF